MSDSLPVMATLTEVPYVEPVYSVAAFRADCKEIIARGAKTFYKEWWQTQAKRFVVWKEIWCASGVTDSETADLISEVEELRREALGWFEVSDSDDE